jgi:hypothetical protein
VVRVALRSMQVSATVEFPAAHWKEIHHSSGGDRRVAQIERQREPGFETPEAVRETTEEYREEMDPLAGFLQACCCRDPQAADLYEAYQRYCTQNKDDPLKKNAF